VILRPPGISPRGPRRGFTILELLLASVIAIMLLSAVYLSFDMTVQQTQASRDSAGTEDLVRGVINRLSIDIGAVLGPLPPSSGGTASIQASYTNASAGATGASVASATVTGATTVSATGMTSSSSSSSSSTQTPLLGSGLNIPLEAGVIGGYQNQMNMLVLFTSRVPDVFTGSGANSLAQLYNTQSNSNSNMQYPADLRRVVYWLGNNGGLYRQETPWVTGEYSWSLSDLPLQDDPSSLIAEEVTQFDLEYYDPFEETWETTWDGTGGTQPPYSMTPGPPPAIRITLTFKFGNPRGGAPISSTIQHTFPILAATGQITQTLYDPTSGATSSSGSSNSNVVGAKTVGAQVVGASTTGK
jgi:type II secretory pathway pseudopilin PulG